MNTRFLEHFGAWGDHVGFVVFTVQSGGIPTVSRWNPRSAFIRKCIASNTSNLENGRASVAPCEKVTKDKCVYFCDVSEIFLTEAGAKKFLAESIQLDLSASKLLIESELAHQTKLNEMLSKLGADSKAQQVAVPAWAATADKMPEPLNNVLAFSGKKQPIRAMWVPAKTLEDSGDGDFGEYDEATDQTYWPEGWYETNAYEETHWLVDGQVTHWMPLPAAPQGAKP